MCNDGSVEYGRLQCWQRRVQQAAVRLSASAQPGLPPGRRAAGDRRSRSTRRSWRRRLRLVYLLDARAVRRSRCRVVRRAGLALMPEQIDVVRDRGGRAVGVAGMRLLALLAAATSCAFRQLAALGARGGHGRLCGPVPSGVAPRSGSSVCVICVAASADDLREPRVMVGRAAVRLGSSAVHVAHLFAVRQADWGTSGARFSLAVRCRQPARERTGSISTTSAFPSFSRCSRCSAGAAGSRRTA